MPRQLMSFGYAAKDLLRNKADHVIVEGLLTVLIGEHVTITKVLESESNQGSANGKFNRVDMLCESDKGELILFEIQQDYQIDYFHRIAYGAEKAQTEYISAGDSYGKLRRVYAITIAYFDLGQGSDYLYVGKTEFRSYHNPDSLLQLSDEQKKTYKIQTPSEIFPIYYIIKVNQFDKIATTPLDEWINFLKTNEIKDDTQSPDSVKPVSVSRLPNSLSRSAECTTNTLTTSALQKAFWIHITILEFSGARNRGLRKA